MRCNPSLYHYNGYCFNKSRVPDGQLAIKETKCEELDQELVTTIIA